VTTISSSLTAPRAIGHFSSRRSPLPTTHSSRPVPTTPASMAWCGSRSSLPRRGRRPTPTSS
jgi:hypothetical protein